MSFIALKAAKKSAPFPAQETADVVESVLVLTRIRTRGQTRSPMKSVPVDQRRRIHDTASDTGAPLVVAH
ncbi:hypothetical protein CJU94_01760 [Paraburkholderia aromaticivorans]|uniref:Uncharacterized protein n=1 Tax=Paraburkholderia aromaticivorans TaxID=2026199 RepID=A0A248VDP1_9BURK|nr:hypothetical protein CJU94_01760 [Paraburkholderia aromaticivorans]